MSPRGGELREPPSGYATPEARCEGRGGKESTGLPVAERSSPCPVPKHLRRWRLAAGRTVSGDAPNAGGMRSGDRSPSLFAVAHHLTSVTSGDTPHHPTHPQVIGPSTTRRCIVSGPDRDRTEPEPDQPGTGTVTGTVPRYGVTLRRASGGENSPGKKSGKFREISPPGAPRPGGRILAPRDRFSGPPGDPPERAVSGKSNIRFHIP